MSKDVFTALMCYYRITMPIVGNEWCMNENKEKILFEFGKNNCDILFAYKILLIFFPFLK